MKEKKVQLLARLVYCYLDGWLFASFLVGPPARPELVRRYTLPSNPDKIRKTKFWSQPAGKWNEAFGTPAILRRRGYFGAVQLQIVHRTTCLESAAARAQDQKKRRDKASSSRFLPALCVVGKIQQRGSKPSLGLTRQFLTITLTRAPMPFSTSHHRLTAGHSLLSW